MNKWHCAIDGRKYGPVSADELCRWLAEGRLKSADHVWTEGMDDWVPCNTVEEFNCQTAAQPVQQQGNRKATAGMVFGLVGVIGIGIFPPLMAVGIWFMQWPLVCLAICLWAVSGIAGLYLSIAGVNRARETKSGRGMAIAGIILSCITLAMMTIQTIIALRFVA